ncbi:hypothetical protein BC832DRAFT_552130 [Gaertneriomyces semiglobifer]|nr:hypothetical protein BC832DRAFT_552130 [Gaertneriomyces semiglobifer]
MVVSCVCVWLRDSLLLSYSPTQARTRALTGCASTSSREHLFLGGERLKPQYETGVPNLFNFYLKTISFGSPCRRMGLQNHHPRAVLSP